MTISSVNQTSNTNAILAIIALAVILQTSLTVRREYREYKAEQEVKQAVAEAQAAAAKSEAIAAEFVAQVAQQATKARAEMDEDEKFIKSGKYWRQPGTGCLYAAGIDPMVALHARNLGRECELLVRQPTPQ